MSPLITGTTNLLNPLLTRDVGSNTTNDDVNSQYRAGDTTFILVASFLVLLMPPGLGFLYSGLSRRKSSLSIMLATSGAFSITVFQWYFWGYSLAFSRSGTSGYIGDLKHFGLQDTFHTASPANAGISELLYSFYQMLFCATTAAIVVGAIAERGRMVPMMIFIFLWDTIVYCPLAYWIWNVNGWAYQYGALDFAGGGPVEIASGFSALGYSIILGKRHEKLSRIRPNDVPLIFLGTILLWFGWLGFNGGSALVANSRAVIACWNSCLAAMFGAATWCLLDWRLAGRWSLVAWCSGTITGLVAATPTCGFIPLWASVILGVVSAVASNYGTHLKDFVGVDEPLDIFAGHGVAGVVGLIFNALFAAKSIMSLDGVSVGPAFLGGWVDHHYRQMYVQVAYIVAAAAYSFVISTLLAYLIDKVPGLHLRADDQSEIIGMDYQLADTFKGSAVAWGESLIPLRTVNTEQNNKEGGEEEGEKANEGDS